MSGSFTGFSEDYIRKLSNGNGEDCSTKSKSTGIHGNVNTSPKKQDKNMNTRNELKEEKRHEILNTKIEKSNLEPITENAKLCQITDNPLDPPTTNLENEPLQLPSNIPPIQESAAISGKTNLEVIQARQKLIEDQNKKRKELLSKVLADKTKRTLAETQKLKEIQSEFQKLDSLHSGDINILRKQIELASVDYMEAEKRYHKFEKDYLNSKLDLHLKLERKELLAEHLSAIIERNEERKAKKLNEMLLQLNLSLEIDDNKD